MKFQRAFTGLTVEETILFIYRVVFLSLVSCKFDLIHYLFALTRPVRSKLALVSKSLFFLLAFLRSSRSPGVVNTTSYPFK